jgi:multiple sugar transport system permease protein
MRISRNRDVSGWLIMAPALALFAFFVWAPLLESVRLSLFTAKGIRLIEFAGLANYRSVLNHPDFKAALANTFLYTFWSLAIGFWVPILLALLIGETTRGKGFFRLSSYFPNIVPGLATILMWGFLLKPGKTGVLNMLLSHLSVGPFTWLNNKALVIPMIVSVMTWKAAGSTALIYMAGLASIDQELYEAAAIDGAGVFSRLRRITLPAIMSLGATLLILQIIAVFQILYEPLVMTNGGPNNASISLMQLVYKYAFEKFDYPRASAVSVIVSLILMVLTVVYNRINKLKGEAYA